MTEETQEPTTTEFRMAFIAEGYVSQGTSPYPIEGESQ